MEMSKGFVRTLEAIIASMIFLGVVLVVVPDQVDQGTGRPTVRNSVHDTLTALDRTGDLGDNTSPEAIENDIDPYIPAGFNHSVQVYYTTNESIEAEPGDRFYFNSSNYREILFWVEESGITANYAGEDLISSASEGYYRRQVDSSGWLNFSGSGKARFDYDSYRVDGESVSKENLITVSYVLGDVEKEVQVNLWR